MASEAGRSSYNTLAQMAAPAQFRCMPPPNLPHSASICSRAPVAKRRSATLAAPLCLRFVWPRRS
eukprot:799294-Pleurochrysis_carterae.AAC.1